MQVTIVSIAYGLIGAATIVAVGGIAVLLFRSPVTRAAAPGVMAFLAVWYGAVFGLSGAGVFATRIGAAFFGLSIVLPLAAGVVALWRQRPYDDPAPLVGLQAYRVAGAAMLLLLAIGQLPAAFAVPAGVGDVLVGLAALPVARALQAGRLAPAVVWNLLGLLDLTVAVSLGLAGSPLLRLLAVTPDTAAMTATPMVVIPAFAVPLSALLHLASLRSLRACRVAAGRDARRPSVQGLAQELHDRGGQSRLSHR